MKIFSTKLLLMTIILIFASFHISGQVSNQITNVNVGLLTPQTGELLAFSSGFENAAALAISHLNSDPLFADYSFGLTIYDTATTPEGAGAAMTQAVTDGMHYVVGAAGSSNTFTAGEVAKYNQIPLISYASTSPALTTFDDHAVPGDNGYVWRIPPSDSLQGKVIAEMAFNEGYSSMALIHLDNSYGIGIADRIESEFLLFGGSVPLKLSYNPALNDFNSIVTQIIAQNPDVIVLVSYATDGSLLAIELESQNVNIPVIGADGLASEEVLNEHAGTQSAMQGFNLTRPTIWNSPMYQEFIDAYYLAYPSAMGDIYIAQTYDAVFAGAHAILLGGSTVGSDIIASLSSVSFNGASDIIAFDANGDSTAGYFEIYEVIGSSFVLVNTWHQGTFNANPITHVRLGLLTPQTGLLSAYSIGFENGVQMAVDKLYDDPKFSQYAFSLWMYDTETTPEGAASAMTQAVNDGVHLVIGAAGSSMTLAAAPIAIENQIPMISYASSSPDLTTLNDHSVPNDQGYVWRVAQSDALEGLAIAELIFNSGYESVVIVQDGDVYPQFIGDAVVANFESLGGSVFQDITYQSNNADVGNIVSLIADHNPDVVVLSSFSQDGAQIIEGLYNQGIQIPTIGITAMYSETIFNELVQEEIPLQGLVVTKYPIRVGENYSEFVNEYESIYGSLNDVYVSHAYDAVFAGANAIFNAESLHGPEIIQSLATLHFEGVTGEISFNENGDLNGGSYDFVQINGREFNPVAHWDFHEGVSFLDNQFGSDWLYWVSDIQSSSTPFPSSSTPTVALPFDFHLGLLGMLTILIISKKKVIKMTKNSSKPY